ncbi:MAG: hypothetical protein ACRDZN_09635 [Acidimicrobiales bacterium]
MTQFPSLVAELVARFETLTAAPGALTLVFDAGQNSQDNLALIAGRAAAFRRLAPSDHPDLVVFGNERRIIVTHSANHHAKQSRGFDPTPAKAHRQLTELAARLARGKTRKPRDGVDAEIAAILKPRWLSGHPPTELVGDTPAELRLSFHTDPKARKAVADR